MPARYPSLRQFRLKRAVESMQCENTTAAWVKTMTELVIQDLEPQSKWNSSDAVKNRSANEDEWSDSLIVFHTDSLYAYVKEAESATDAPQVQPRARASECSDWIFWSVFTNENLRVLIKTNVWHGISWISKMWLCRSMMVTCLHGTRLSDSSGWNGPLNPCNVKIPLQLELKPWQNLLSRTLSRNQNEIVVMPSKIAVQMKTNEVIVIVFHTDSLYAYVKEAESATDAPQVQPRARASECSDWIFWSVFTNENLRVLIKTNVWHGISWISKMWLCRSMMVTCLHGTRLSDSSGWNGPLNPLNVTIPLQLELKPWQNLLSRTLSRHQNEIVVMPSKIAVKWKRMKW